eukprot:1147765-Pelagomonas_calceolata.AAC.2
MNDKGSLHGLKGCIKGPCAAFKNLSQKNDPIFQAANSKYRTDHSGRVVKQVRKGWLRRLNGVYITIPKVDPAGITKDAILLGGSRAKNTEGEERQKDCDQIYGNMLSKRQLATSLLEPHISLRALAEGPNSTASGTEPETVVEGKEACVRTRHA